MPSPSSLGSRSGLMRPSSLRTPSMWTPNAYNCSPEKGDVQGPAFGRKPVLVSIGSEDVFREL